MERQNYINSVNLKQNTVFPYCAAKVNCRSWARTVKYSRLGKLISPPLECALQDTKNITVLQLVTVGPC